MIPLSTEGGKGLPIFYAVFLFQEFGPVLK